MRHFISTSAALAACNITAITIAGGPQLQPLQNAIEVTPIRFAGIDKNNHLTTPWFYTKDLKGTDSNCGDDLIWDGFDYDTPDGGPANGELCVSTFNSTGRWFFGPSYCNTWAIHGFTVHAADPDNLSDHGKFAWFWFGDGNPTGSEQCYLVTFTYEDFDSTCNGPAASNAYPGVIVDFGMLPTNPGGYYLANINDLCSVGLGYTMPMDGTGAYDLQLWNFYDGNNFAFGTCGQPMLWGPRDTTTQGTATDIQWNDDTDIDANGNCTADVNGNCLNLSDGIIQAPFECYDYRFGLCPEPLATMAAFLGDALPPGCGMTLDIDQIFGGATSTFTITRGLPNQVVAIVYGFLPGKTTVSGVAGYCATFGIDGVNASRVVTQGRVDPNGQFSAKKLIPLGAVGKRVLFEAAMRNTCPDECVSNILDLIVL